jgi:hypothetical protein
MDRRAKRANGHVVATLLFLCVSAGWAVSAFAACPPPATTVFFVNGITTTMSEATASLDALAPQLRAGV